LRYNEKQELWDHQLFTQQQGNIQTPGYQAYQPPPPPPQQCQQDQHQNQSTWTMQNFSVPDMTANTTGYEM
jgi:hypothetical protein